MAKPFKKHQEKTEEKVEQKEEVKKPKKVNTDRLFHFSDVTVDGKDGITIEADNQDQALEKLNNLLSNQK